DISNIPKAETPTLELNIEQQFVKVEPTSIEVTLTYICNQIYKGKSTNNTSLTPIEISYTQIDKIASIIIDKNRSSLLYKKTQKYQERLERTTVEQIKED
ncbi:13660_t:CDS:2, partial [Dentiscutata heterogama]